ncbi:MAG: hypothetical protein EPN91_07610 [Salinibacterium sp.]|nr:MAG: hypothetical protein EPN91_07610 [Salinibacterium sp.]
MKSKRIGIAILVVATALGLTACSASEPVLPRGNEKVTLDPAKFSTQIDNPYWPMKPGTRWTFRETDAEGTVFTVVVIVTDKTKTIANGIKARVVRDTAYQGNEIVEDTFDWYAQDSFGSIWYLGEDTAEFEHGKVVSRAGSFEAGLHGAQAGVLLPGHPQVGQSYREEYQAGEAEDNGEILSLVEQADTPFRHFTDMLLIKDTSAIEPDVVEYKFYARGFGAVLTLDVSGGSGREELVKVDKAPAGAGTGPLGHP